MSETWLIKTYDGEEYPLRTDGVCFYDGTYESIYNLLKETEGHHGIPRTLLSDEIPEIAGEELRQIKEDMRTQYLPLRITGLNSADFHKNMAKLRKSLVNGEAQLWITNEEGDTRILYCNYKSGFDKAIDGSKRGRNWISVPLYLQANDPYFYDQPGVDIDNVYYQEPWTTKFLTKTVMYELKDAGSPYATDNTSEQSYLAFKEYPRGLGVGSPIDIISIDRTTPHRAPTKLAAERVEKRVFKTDKVGITDAYCQSCVDAGVTGIIIWWGAYSPLVDCNAELAPYITLIASYGLDVWLDIEYVINGHFTTETTLAQYSSDTTVPGAAGVAWGTIMSGYDADPRIAGFVFEGSYDVGVQFLRSVTDKTLTQCWLFEYGSYYGGEWDHWYEPTTPLFNKGAGDARTYRLLNVDELLWEVYYVDQSINAAEALPFFKKNFPNLKVGFIGIVAYTGAWEYWQTYAYMEAHNNDVPPPPALSYDATLPLITKYIGDIRDAAPIDIAAIFDDGYPTPINEQLQNVDDLHIGGIADPAVFDTTTYEIKDESGTFSGYNKIGQPNLSLKTPPDKLKVGDTIKLYGTGYPFGETHVVASIPGTPTQYFVGLHDNLTHDYTEAISAFVSREGLQRDVSHESVYRETHTITEITNPETGVYRAKIGTETLSYSHFEESLAYVSFSDPADHFLNPTPILETTLIDTGTIGDAAITIADTALCAAGDTVRIIDPIKNLYEENVIATVTDGNTLTLDTKIVNTYLLANVPLVLVNRRVVNSDCVFVIYWLTGCPPCYRALAQLQALKATYSGLDIKYVEITQADPGGSAVGAICHYTLGMTQAATLYPEGYAFAQACGPPLPALYHEIGTVMPAVITLYRSGIFIKGWCGVHTTNVDAVSDAILLDACGNRMKWRLSRTWIGYKVPIDNTGDAIAYPIWTLYGPGRTPRLTNVTTGKQLQLDHDLLEGEVVVVDSRDGAHTCGSNREGGEFIAGYTDSEPCPTCHGIGTIPSTCESCGGTEICPSCHGTGIIDVWIPNSFGTTQLIGDMYNLRNELADTSQSFWGLAPSVNVVEMEMDSTNTTTSKIELQFQKKYEGI